METLNISRTRNGRRGTRSSAGESTKRSSRSGRHTTPLERTAIYVLASAAALGAAFASGAPTTVPVMNLLLRAGFAFGVTLAASRSRRWSWLVMTGVAVLCANGIWLSVAGTALVLALIFCFMKRRRVYGAIVAALAVQALLRLPALDAGLGSAAAAALAVVPVLSSAYLASPRRIRRRVHLSVLAAAAVVFVGVAVLGIAALLANGPTNEGANQTRNGMNNIREGRTPVATKTLRKAEDSFRDAHKIVSGPWMWPARIVPVVSLQANAVEEVTAQGAAVTAAAYDVTSQVDYESLRQTKGQVNLSKIRDAQEPLAKASSALDAAMAKTEAVEGPWLIPPLAAGIDDFQKQLDKVRGETSLAAEASRVLPGMLGQDGTRRYFVAFITPSEERGLGGFMGNWAELTAHAGKIEITNSGRAKDLNDRTNPDTMVITSDADYAARYGKYRPGRYMQDVTLSPDLPSVSKVIAELYPKLGGTQIDGVLVIDPTGLAALLQLTGPVKVKGLDQPLKPKTAVEFLTKGQYYEFGSREDRVDFLDEAGRKTFEALFAGDLPGPRKLSEVLSPAVENQRIRFWSLHDEEQHLLQRVGVDGTFPRADGNDFFSLRTQNKSNNKIDIFLERKIRYEVNVDPGAGTVTADVTIDLHNGAPASGIPDAIIGSNDQGLPPGTNAMNLSIYSALGLREARINEEASGMEYQRELGHAVYSRYLELPPGSTTTLRFQLFGTVEGLGRGAYHLDFSSQPMINPDEVVVSAKVQRPFKFAAHFDGATPDLAIDQGGTDAFAAFKPERDATLIVDLVER